jgi:3-hydroxyisobutyrate dehydrogenase
MARNLVKNNYEVLVFDLSPASVKSVTETGAKSADSPAEVASKMSTIVTMLPSSPHVKDVYAGDDGIFSAVQKGSLLVDSSTIDPSVSQEMAALATEKGATFMDAPVSGGVVAARDALLTFMVGGPESKFGEAEALLSKMGKNVVHCGDVGTGQAAKICNNMLLGISMIGASETMNLGISLGLDPKLLAKILNMSSGRCWSTEMYNPCPGVIEGIPSSNNYQGGFGTALMAKDLGLAQNAATATLSPTPMGSLAHQIYRIMSKTDLKSKDFASVFKFLQEQVTDSRQG